MIDAIKAGVAAGLIIMASALVWNIVTNLKRSEDE